MVTLGCRVHLDGAVPESAGETRPTSLARVTFESTESIPGEVVGAMRRAPDPQPRTSPVPRRLLRTPPPHHEPHENRRLRQAHLEHSRDERQRDS